MACVYTTWSMSSPISVMCCLEDSRGLLEHLTEVQCGQTLALEVCICIRKFTHP